MEYSIKELSRLSGVSARTLRYYDEIGLLKPSRVTDTGYRYYAQPELALLQQILFYRERGFDLKTIQKLIYDKDFDMLKSHGGSSSGTGGSESPNRSADPHGKKDDSAYEGRLRHERQGKI